MTSSYDDKLAEGYRTALDLYKVYPRFGMPTSNYSGIVYYFTDADAKDTMIAARRALALGKWTKRVDDNFYRLDSKLDDGTKITLMVGRDEACEQIVTGTKTEEQEAMVCPECEGKVGPDGEGGMVCLVNGRKDYYARPLKKLVKLVEVPKTEWVCAPVLEAKHDLAVTS